MEGTNTPKYNSQELDKETGYYFYNARHYDPEIARFVTPDTVIDGEGDTQGWNRFSYVKGNPIRYKDPTGHNNEENIEFKEGESSEVIQNIYDEVAKNKDLNNSQKATLFDKMVRDKLLIPQQGLAQKNCIATSKTIALMAEGVIKNKSEVANGNNIMDTVQKILYQGKDVSERTSAGDEGTAYNCLQRSPLSKKENIVSNYEQLNETQISKLSQSNEIGKGKKGKYTFKDISPEKALEALKKGKMLVGYSSPTRGEERFGNHHATAYYLNPFSKKVMALDPYNYGHPGGYSYTISDTKIENFSANTSGVFEILERKK